MDINELMRQAVEIKGAQVGIRETCGGPPLQPPRSHCGCLHFRKPAQAAQDRRLFDTWPSYLQYTVFNKAVQEVCGQGGVCVHARGGADDGGTPSQDRRPLAAKMADAERLKEEGNTAFKSEDWSGAAKKYEEALALFKFLVNRDPGWRESKKGLRDEDLRVVVVTADTPAEQSALDALRVKCYQNLAAVLLRVCPLPTSPFPSPC